MAVVLGCCLAPVRFTSARPATTVQIRIETERTSLLATLDDTEAARDFASLLPSWRASGAA